MQSMMYVSRKAYGWEQRQWDLFLFRGKGDDSDEEDDEDDNNSKAGDYDGGDGDDKFFRCSTRDHMYRMRVDKAYRRIASSVEVLCDY